MNDLNTTYLDDQPFCRHTVIRTIFQPPIVLEVCANCGKVVSVQALELCPNCSDTDYDRSSDLS